MAGTGGHFGPESVVFFAPEWVVAFSGILSQGVILVDFGSGHEAIVGFLALALNGPPQPLGRPDGNVSVSKRWREGGGGAGFGV